MGGAGKREGVDGGGGGRLGRPLVQLPRQNEGAQTDCLRHRQHSLWNNEGEGLGARPWDGSTGSCGAPECVSVGSRGARGPIWVAWEIPEGVQPSQGEVATCRQHRPSDVQ